jgi:hypothetical protein
MLKRILFICGIAAALLPIAAVVTGGILRPGYDHVSMAVIELVERGAPNKLLLDFLFAVSCALLISFAWAVGMASRGEGLPFLTAGSIILGLAGVLGIVMIAFFPADPQGALPTVQGTGQVLISYGISLAMVLSVFFLGLGSRVRDSFWVFSLVFGVLVLAAQAVFLTLAAGANPFLGLAERIAVGLFLLWMVVYISRLFAEDAGKL